jgi:AcrR family transcriptional regulator
MLSFVTDAVTNLTKGERTRQALLDAAVRRFAADGYRTTSLADIAREAGITPAAAYPYFGGKDGLFTAAVDADAAGLIDEAVFHVVDDRFDGDWVELIAKLLAGLEHHPLARRILAGLEPEHTERLLNIPALADLRVGIAALIRTQQSSGLVRTDIDPELISAGLVTSVMALLIAALQTGVSPEGEATAGVLALFEAALKPPALQQSATTTARSRSRHATRGTKPASRSQAS